MYKVERSGRRKITTISEGHLETIFSEVDNLDEKTISQAEDNYERTFVVMRRFLEENGQFCCDDEQDRLNLCQGLTDRLRNALLIRKDA